MLEVYKRAYRLYVVTYKICQMLQSWDKLLSTSTSTEIQRDCGITVRSSRKCFCPKMRAFASRIFSEFKQIELNWNRIVHQNALWGLVFWSGLLPDHETNESAHRMQVSLPARNRMTGRRSETFEDLWYLFSSEDKYKGFSLYQTEDWLIDWNQLQFWNGAGDEVARLRE